MSSWTALYFYYNTNKHSLLFLCPWPTNTQGERQGDLEWQDCECVRLKDQKKRSATGNRAEPGRMRRERDKPEEKDGIEREKERLRIVICQRWQGWVEQTCSSPVPLVSFHGNTVSHPYTYTVCSSTVILSMWSSWVCMRKWNPNNVVHVEWHATGDMIWLAVVEQKYLAHRKWSFNF